MTSVKYKIVGVKGKPQKSNFIEQLQCDLNGKILSHSFLYVPECLILLRRDLLYKLGSTIYLRNKNLAIYIPKTLFHYVALLLPLSAKDKGLINLEGIESLNMGK